MQRKKWVSNTRLWFVMILTGILCSCAREEQDTTLPEEGFRLVIEQSHTLVKDNTSGIKEKNYQLINDVTAFEDIWQRHTAGRIPQPEPPKIDFSTQSVVAVAMGERNSGGYSITIDEITSGANSTADFAASLTTESPGRGCIVTMALTQPVHMVVVPKIQGTLTFTEMDTTKHCDTVSTTPNP